MALFQTKQGARFHAWPLPNGNWAVLPADGAPHVSGGWLVRRCVMLDKEAKPPQRRRTRNGTRPSGASAAPGNGFAYTEAVRGEFKQMVEAGVPTWVAAAISKVSEQTGRNWITKYGYVTPQKLETVVEIAPPPPPKKVEPKREMEWVSWMYDTNP